MRVLITSSPSPGLFFPMVPLAWALRTAGHDVLVTAPANMAGVVTGAGLPFCAAAGDLDIGVVMNTDRAGKPIPRPMEEQANLVHTGRGFAKVSALMLDRIHDIARQWGADLVLSEHHEYAGGLVAARLRLHWAVHPIGMGSVPAVDEAAAAELAPELDRFGLDAMPEPHLRLDPCPPSVALADRPGNTRQIRQVPYNDQHTAGVPEPEVTGDGPLVLVTMGTRIPRKLGLDPLRMLISALHARGARVMVALADDLVPDLGPLPPGVHAGWVPVDQIVPRSDLVVHQCGSGTTMAALAAGVPQLLIPYISEQRDMARRLRDFGAVELIEPFTEAPDLVEDACGRLLGMPSYAARSAALAAEIGGMPDPATVTAEMARVLATV